jgi:hypothetical protein
MIIGGIILLLGIRTTFYTKTLSVKIYLKSNSHSLATQKKKYEKFKSYSDADDTLFINETYFETGTKVLRFDGRLFIATRISQQLFKVEIDNLKIYGYGIKATFSL